MNNNINNINNNNNSLQASCMTHKFVDDTTLSEVLGKTATSCMQAFCDELVQQSEEARMNVNGRKTKEMMIGPISKDPPAYLLLCGVSVDRVATFKLLGVFVSCDLKWSEHVDAIVPRQRHVCTSSNSWSEPVLPSGTSCTSTYLYYGWFLSMHARYGTLVWLFYSLTNARYALESVQKRAISMIYSDADYETSLIVAGIDTLRNRREKLTARFFKRQVLASSSPLQYMLPDHRDNDTISTLRNPKPFHTIRARTNKFRKWFLPYCLDNYT